MWTKILWLFCCLFVVLVTKSCLTLGNPMDCSQPGSSVYGISQARILEWVAISFSRGSTQPRDRIWVSHIAGWFFTPLGHYRTPSWAPCVVQQLPLALRRPLHCMGIWNVPCRESKHGLCIQILLLSFNIWIRHSFTKIQFSPCLLPMTSCRSTWFVWKAPSSSTH